MARRTVALIGYGTLSREFCRHFGRVLGANYELLGALVRHVPTDAPADMAFWTSVDGLLPTGSDYVVEFAGVGAVAEYGEDVLAAGSTFVVASAGALADDALRGRLAAAARRSDATLHVMSGAVGGFDMLRTMALDPATRFSINNVKAPESIEGAPFLGRGRLSREKASEVFRGSARRHSGLPQERERRRGGRPCRWVPRPCRGHDDLCSRKARQHPCHRGEKRNGRCSPRALQLT